MAEVAFLAFNCLNPECGKKIKLPRPPKSGVYAVTCPHCGLEKPIKIKGQDEVMNENATQGQPQNAGVNTDKPAIELQDDFIAGNPYTFKCPHCETQEIGFKTEKPGHRTIECPSCKGKIGLDIRKKTEVILLTDQLQMFKGKLTLLRKGWINKEFKLKEGKQTIGRYDEQAMSDISVKNDPSMSRRSVEIEVNRTMKGLTFKLTVLKSTNPVLHNNNPLMNGESVSLNFGDMIIMGKTKFRFDKDT